MKSVIALLVVLVTVAVALLAMEPPSVVPASAPPTVFSAARALVHVQALARAPHPPGTTEHDRVRDELVRRFSALGLTVRVQKTVAWRSQSLYVQAATVENIIARLPGKQHEKPVMLAAHYDSHHTGPGAGDDGAGVAAALEVARALRADVTPERDVLFVVTDAEEWGLIGAQGFVDDAPEAREVGVVLNAEARGGGGPVFMFETSDHNAALIAHFAASASQPRASSLMYALYKLLPNDTDLTVFKKAGLPGLNFAFAGQWTHYHTALDTPEKLDARSLQHHGDLLLATARQLTKADPATLAAGGDAVYFDLLGRVLVAYPLWLVWPLTLLAVGLLVVAIARSRRDTNFARSLGAGLGLFPALLSVGGLVAHLYSVALAPLRAGVPWDDPYDARVLEAGLFAFVAGVVTLGIALQPRRFSERPLLLGTLIGWALVLVLATVFLPGASYLFVWPLLIAVALQLPKKPLPAEMAAVPTLVLATPVLHGLGLLLGFGMPLVLGILVALVFVPLVGLVRGAAGKTRLVLPLVLLVGGLACLGVGYGRNTASAERPRTDTLFYALDADTNQARWVSADSKNDAWTGGFLGENATTAPGDEFFPWSRRRYRVAPAPQRSVLVPTVVRSGNSLTIRTEAMVQEVVVAGAGVRGARLGGKPLPTLRSAFCLRFLAPPRELILELDAPPDTPLTVDTYTYQLPEKTAPRPAGLIAQPLAPATDLTLVRTRPHNL